jgi:hypothetical protein
MSNTNNKKQSDNASVKKIVEIPNIGKVGKAKNGIIAHNPPPKPIKVPKK